MPVWGDFLVEGIGLLLAIIISVALAEYIDYLQERKDRKQRRRLQRVRKRKRRLHI